MEKRATAPIYASISEKESEREREGEIALLNMPNSIQLFYEMVICLTVTESNG